MAKTLSWTALKKRFVVGMQLRVVRNTYRPEVNGQIRTITKVQTNALMFDVDGKSYWLNFPSSAKDVEILGTEADIQPFFRLYFPADKAPVLSPEVGRHFVEMQIL